MSQQHPFDDPFAADPGPATYVPSAGHDYSRSVVSHTGRSFRPGFRATSGLNAPLVIVGSQRLLHAGIMLYPVAGVPGLRGIPQN